MANSTDMFMSLIQGFNPKPSYQPQAMNFDNFNPTAVGQGLLGAVNKGVKDYNTNNLLGEYLATQDEGTLMQLAQTNPEIAGFLLEKRKLDAQLAPKGMTPYQAAQLDIERQKLEQQGQLTPAQAGNLALRSKEVFLKEQAANRPKLTVSGGKALIYDPNKGTVLEQIDLGEIPPEQQAEAESLLQQAQGGDSNAEAALASRYPDYYRAFNEGQKRQNFQDRTQAFKIGSVANQKKTEQSVRKEFTSNVQPYIQSLDQVNRLEAILNDPKIGGTGERAAITTLQKILDPTSTVSINEFKILAESSGVWNQIKNYPRAKYLGQLPPELIAQVKNVAAQMKKVAQDKVMNNKSAYGKIAVDMGADPELITGTANPYLPSAVNPDVQQYLDLWK